LRLEQTARPNVISLASEFPSGRKRSDRPVLDIQAGNAAEVAPVSGHDNAAIL
jgi:hypothetical protein